VLFTPILLNNIADQFTAQDSRSDIAHAIQGLGGGWWVRCELVGSWSWEGEIAGALKKLVSHVKDAREMTERKEECSGSSSKEAVRRNPPRAAELEIKLNKNRRATTSDWKSKPAVH
jgi:hypothetical protein